MDQSAHRPVSLSYVLPVYNEEEILDATIGIFLRDLDSLSPIVREFELIVVDDKSTDGSLAIAEEWARKDPRIVLVRHPVNRGVGQGILTGIHHATKEWLSINCADRPFDTRDIAVVHPLMADHEIVVVARYDRSANTWYRKLTSWVNYQLVRLLFGIPVDDCQFIQFYRRDVVKEQPVVSEGTLVPPELIIRAWRRGARIGQVRLPFHRRLGGVAKYGHPRYALRTLREMVQLRLQLWREDARARAASPRPTR